MSERYNPEAVFDRYQQLMGYSLRWGQCLPYARKTWVEITFPQVESVVARPELKTSEARFAAWDNEFGRGNVLSWPRLDAGTRLRWTCLFQAMEEALSGTLNTDTKNVACTCPIFSLANFGCPKMRGEKVCAK